MCWRAKRPSLLPRPSARCGRSDSILVMCETVWGVIGKLGSTLGERGAPSVFPRPYHPPRLPYSRFTPICDTPAAGSAVSPHPPLPPPSVLRLC